MLLLFLSSVYFTRSAPRTLGVAAESRALPVATEDRKLAIAAESRTHTVPKQESSDGL